mgnify:CR=1 FL=1
MPLVYAELVTLYAAAALTDTPLANLYADSKLAIAPTVRSIAALAPSNASPESWNARFE